MSELEDLHAENERLREAIERMEARYEIEIKCWRGSCLAKKLIDSGVLPNTTDAVGDFLEDFAQFTDEEVERLERKVRGEPEFDSVEECEMAIQEYENLGKFFRYRLERAEWYSESLRGNIRDCEENAACCREFLEGDETGPRPAS